MRVKLVLTVTGVLVLTVITIGSVLALFTDSDAVGSNTFTNDTLDPPTSLTAGGGSSITLNWTATADTYASGHHVLRATATGGPYTQIAEVTPRTTTAYTDAPAAGTYYYVVRAFFLNWESVDSNEASATKTGSSIAFDAASSLNGNTSALTWSHTVGAGGANRIIVVGVSFETGATITGVTYGGQALAPIGGRTDSDSATRVELWYKVAPLTGANNVVVSMSGVTRVLGGATSWTGVDQTTPLGTAAFADDASNAASPATVDVSSAAGEVVVDAVSTDGVTPTVGGGQTERWNLTAAKVAGGGSSEPGAATVTMSWTFADAPWAIGGVSLKVAP